MYPRMIAIPPVLSVVVIKYCRRLSPCRISFYMVRMARNNNKSVVHTNYYKFVTEITRFAPGQHFVFYATQIARIKPLNDGFRRRNWLLFIASMLFGRNRSCSVGKQLIAGRQGRKVHLVECQTIECHASSRVTVTPSSCGPAQPFRYLPPRPANKKELSDVVE